MVTIFADQRGGVAPIFALAIVPIIGLVGAAVDYSRGNAARTAMQAALDATALMLSRDAADMTPAQVTAKATAYLQRAVQPPRGRERSGHRRAEQSAAGQLHARRDGERQRADDVHQAARPGASSTSRSSAQVKWGIKKLELALVLDNTGSMANNGKLTQLKTAAHNLLTTLQTAAKQPGDVKVAIIPFDTKVNIGTGYKDRVLGRLHGATTSRRTSGRAA